MTRQPIDPAWQRLADLLVKRRVSLDPKYKSRRAFCEAKDIDYRVISDLEKARRDNFSPPMITAIEVAYEIADGAIQQALADPAITELPPRRRTVVVDPLTEPPLPDLEPWERHIWANPHLSDSDKEIAILIIRLKRGDLDDDTKGLLRLTRTLNRVVERHLERNDPPHAV
ncbi:MAG UNVERIFIED_CONTAM: hypothetical protein LOD86_06255 [Thermobifida fusca]